jgi:pimeloyl-ACP methyl ester carboxylesterase/predicted glycosyltransferase
MTIRQRDQAGVLDRDGVRVGYEVHGTGGPTMALLPAFPVADKRMWKAQIPHFARHHRVLVLEPRGHGRSGRSTDPAQYTAERRVGDVIALLDETATERAALVGVSQGGRIAVQVAAGHPDRIDGVVAIAPTFGFTMDHEMGQAILRFNEDHGRDEGVWRYNQHSWQRDFEGFIRFFIGACFNEPHSSKAYDDGVAYALETNADVLTAHVLGNAASLRSEASFAETAAKVRCPVMLIHGTSDEVCPSEWSVTAAPQLRARLELIEGAGHGVHGRRPATVNALIDDFLSDVLPAPQPQTRRSSPKGPRVLYLSSPIGLGHARRDVAIADELRRLVPEATVEWLAQDPVTRVLDARDEVIHPASRFLLNESDHLQSATDDHDLHVFDAFRQMDEILVANFMVFNEVVREGSYDLVIGDEAWDVDHFLHEEPRLKQTRFAWLTDFVGQLPMPAKGPRDAELTAEANLEMLEHIEHHPDIRDVSLFVGDPADIIDATFGPGLPSIREWTQHHYDFTGYITGYDPGAVLDRDQARADLGCRPGEVLCIAAVGGSGIGASLLRLVIDAHQLATRSIPGLRTVVVTGPRLDPAALPYAVGVDKRAFVPNLHEYLAAADLAVVQGGLTTTMELTASRIPFLYVPLLNHFEQQFHVRHRLERHRAGTAIDYSTATPESIAASMLDTLQTPIDYRAMPADGASRAATHLVQLLP